MPQTHVRFNYKDFGLEQAVGAIKARVRELGGAIESLTPLKRAQLYKEESLYLEEKKQVSTSAGMEIVKRKVLELFAEIEKLCIEINVSGSASIRVGKNEGQCVLTNNRISLIVAWRQPYTNSTDGCGLKITEYNMQMPLPAERLTLLSNPTELRSLTFLPELSRAREFGWIQQGNPTQFFSSITLAEKCVIQYLNLAERADQGKVRYPDF